MATRRKETDSGARDSAAISRPNRWRSFLSVLRLVTVSCAVVIVTVGLAWAGWNADHFLRTDSRFVIGRQAQIGAPPPIEVTGAENASRRAILAVFNPDRGHSIYSVDCDKRRVQLKTIEWVKDATVRRIWPNRLAVEIKERAPVAFIQMPGAVTGSMENPVSYEPALIDEEGMILRTHVGSAGKLPLLLGLRIDSGPDQRRVAVDRMRELLHALEGYRDNILEVDVSDPNDLRITYQLGDQLLILILGEERFRERLEHFLKHYEGIRDRLPPRSVLDISIEGRVTAIP